MAEYRLIQHGQVIAQYSGDRAGSQALKRAVECARDGDVAVEQKRRGRWTPFVIVEKPSTKEAQP